MSEQLDDTLLKKDQIDYDIRLGKLFGNVAVFFGFAIILLGIVMIGAGIFQNPAGLLIGPLPLLAGMHIAFGLYGVQIDKSKMKIREYVVYLGIFKSGEWQDYSQYPYIAILSLRKTQRMNNMIPTMPAVAINSIEQSDIYPEVYLLNKTHHRRIQIDKGDNYKEAEAKAKEWAQKLDKELTVFNPVQLSARRKRN